MFKNTPEQQAIVDAARDTTAHMMIKAYAGCSKTTTLKLMADVLPPTPSLALAFNVKIKKELEQRFPEHFTVMTMNGLGHRAWGATIRKRLEIDDRKIGRLTTALMKEHGIQDGDMWDTVRQLVGEAMNAGLVPAEFPNARVLMSDTQENWKQLASDAYLDPAPDALGLARAVLTASIRESFLGKISFDDQIYMPVLFHGAFPRFQLVMVDEAQDLSVMNHKMVQQVAAGRLIVVGDPKQSIYAFRGADSSSMEKLRKLRKEWSDFPLTMTFRCPCRVVERQQDHAPGFKAFHTNTAGHVLDLRYATWDITQSSTRELALEWRKDGVDYSHALPRGDTAVLCRNTAPVLRMAFRLIRNRITPMVMGRDIGKGLIKLAKKIIPDDADAAEMHAAIELWRSNEITNAQLNENDGKISGITDRADSLLAVLEAGEAKSKDDMISALEDLFNTEKGAVILGTIHRAKGLEWECVLHLDPWRIPSKYATRAAAAGDTSQLDQEYNLQYVCETRTKDTLVLLSLQDNDPTAEGL